MIRLVFKLAAGTLLLLLIGLAVAWQHYQSAVNQPLNFPSQTFAVVAGDTLGKVAQRMADQGIIGHSLYLKILSKQRGLGHHIRTGEYLTSDITSLNNFLDRIVSGKGIVDLRLTIIEGWTFKQMRMALKEAAGVQQLTADLTDQEVMQKLGFPELHPEGQFYPDTYLYQKGESDLNILKRAMDLMSSHLDQSWQMRTPEVLLRTPYELLILASIIEKETQARDEQPTIAGVFYNRIKKGMRLQTDPTVIYGIGDAYDGNITRAHLRTDTPYNTYTRDGLPPTPICLPGEDSLLAAANPKNTPAFYFVAKGGGRHHFSKTLKEHNQAVQKYILNRIKPKTTGGQG